jgi:hypothetical protein
MRNTSEPERNPQRERYGRHRPERPLPGPMVPPVR